MKTIHPSLDGNFSKDIEVISIKSLGYQSVGSSRQIKKSFLRKKILSITAIALGMRLGRHACCWDIMTLSNIGTRGNIPRLSLKYKVTSHP
jgi:hypothetical protein